MSELREELRAMLNRHTKRYVRIESKGPNDFAMVLSDGTRITCEQMPIKFAEWTMLPNEEPILKLEIPAIITASGIILDETSLNIRGRKRSVNIQDFMKGKDENDNRR